MEISYPFILGVNLPDRMKSSSDLHYFAEIVLIERTSSCQQPLLYQLKDEAVKNADLSLDTQLIPLKDGSFIMLGGVISIDRKNKLIHFSKQSEGEMGQSTIEYEHLIVTHGLHESMNDLSHIENFCMGLHTLIEASRIQSKIPPGFLTALQPVNQFTNPESHKIMKEKVSDRNLLIKLLQESCALKNIPWNIDKRCMYEVQV